MGDAFLPPHESLRFLLMKKLLIVNFEKWVNVEIIVGIPLLIKAIILGIQNVGIEINYHLLTSIYITSILSYTVLEDDANDEK